MTTREVLQTSRGLLRQGRSPLTASFGDWPDAVRVFDQAQRWWRWWPWQGRRYALWMLDRAIALAERDEPGTEVPR
jgi:aryl-phospho-beta-D-glucosidase BglC (GH1 family)